VVFIFKSHGGDGMLNYDENLVMVVVPKSFGSWIKGE
jgi:hypothetical protein